MFGTNKKDTGKQSPISAHPLFPAVVALWFAALLGLGSLVLPVTLFEKAVTTTGVSSVVSAAQPPLGTTARIAIAVLAGLAGAVAGLFIARKVVSAQAATAPARGVFGRAKVTDDADSSLKKPISAHEELGSESLDEPIAEPSSPARGAYAGKRRALAVTDDSGPSEYLEEAPLPGGPAIDQHVDDLPQELLEELVDDAEEADANSIAPLELEELDLAELATEDPVALANADFADGPAAPLEEPAFASAPRPFDAPETSHPVNEIPQTTNDPVEELREEIGIMTDQSIPLRSAPDTDPASVPAAYNPLGTTDATVEADSMPFAKPVEFGGETVGEFAQPLDAKTSSLTQTAGLEAPLTAEHASDGAGLVGNKSLTDLGMVELVERFALALQAKAEKEAEATEQAQAEEETEAAPLVFQRSRSAPAEAPFAPSGAEDAGNAVAEFFASPAPLQQEVAEVAQSQSDVPSTLQPLGLEVGDDAEEHDIDEDSDEVAPLSLSMNTAHEPFLQTPAPIAEAAPARPAQFAALDAIDDEDESEDETEGEGTGFSSLLAMKSPFESGQEFVRVEEEEHDGSVEPTVVFPGSNGTDPHRSLATDGQAHDAAVETMRPSAATPRPFDAPSDSPSHGPAQSAPKANPGETERALRDALEKLQRMSGAA